MNEYYVLWESSKARSGCCVSWGYSYGRCELLDMGPRKEQGEHLSTEPFLLPPFKWSIFSYCFKTDFFLMCVYPHVEAHVWKSEDSLRELIDHFHHVAPGDCTLLVSLGSRYLYVLSHFLYFVCIWYVGVHSTTMCVEVGGQLSGVNLLFLSCEFSILNPGHQAWPQLTLPAELFWLTMAGFLKWEQCFYDFFKKRFI